jgi:putative Holliday junction resolvase
VAISDVMGWLASPLTVLQCRGRDAELDAVAALVHKHQAGLVVVGDPRSLDGSAGPQSQRVSQYVALLAQRLAPVAIALWDERLSTLHAQRLLLESGRRNRRDVIDSAAATLILQSYLDAHREPVSRDPSTPAHGGGSL